MNIAAVYLLHRFFYRLTDFFYHWFMGGSRNISHGFISALERMDKTFAAKITLRHFFEPLYQDYSVIGRILGVIFRTIRLALAAVFYLALAIIFFAVWVVWILIPVVIIGYVFYES
jgi:hypothetical protein